MKMTVLLLALLLPALLAAQVGPRLVYPKTRQGDQVDDYFGTRVKDPYRWLEDDNSAETKAWVEAQNRVTFAYLEAIPERRAIEKRLTALWDYERFSPPSKEGPWYVWGHNSGLQNQAVLFRARGLEATPEVLLDPNTLSKDGTVALGTAHYSDDGSLMAWSTAEAGSDWIDWHVREVATGKDREDHVRWSKFSGAAWKKDDSGFYYSRFPEPKEGDALTAVNKNSKVYFHRMGTRQEEDPLVYERPDQPDWGLGADVTEDGRFLLVYQSEGTEPKNRIFVQDLQDPKGGIAPFLDAFDAEYGAVGNDSDLFYVQTDNGAPRRRLVAIGRRDPSPKAWKEILPQDPGKAVLSSVDMIGERFVVVWQVDAHDLLKIYDKSGRLEREVTLPGIGSVTLSGRRRDKEFFYAFTSFTYPTTIYRCDPSTGESTVF
ncbi:MAG TPA: S9 family peptidase, partial [Vicinamibacteria bacterium]|nr:S9 family peptidase [Vicinamibacteria bacterium]